MPQLTPLDRALEIWLDTIRALEAEDGFVTEARGRTLAAPVLADVDHPPFDTSAMDGWAVHGADAGGQTRQLPIAARIAAGAKETTALAAGTVAKVMTGAPVPPGTEGVIPVERSRDLGELAEITGAARPGDHIRRRGEVFRAGDALVPAGVRLDPRRLALIAAGSDSTLRLTRRPRVDVLISGDELVAAGSALDPGQIRNSNGVFLMAAIEEVGGQPLDAAPVLDNLPAVLAALRRSVADRPDLIVTSGGVSMGDHDLIKPALLELGAEILFHKVAMKPAKPVLAARLDGIPFLGLPGNPVSVAVAWEIFGRSALEKMAGLRRERRLTARAAEAMEQRGPRLGVRDARLESVAGTIEARLIPGRGSHDLLAHSRASALVILDPGRRASEGEIVEVIVLESGRLSGLAREEPDGSSSGRTGEP